KPQVSAFVDDEAGPDVAQKVQRRLQHFIDRKIAAAFEPLIGMSKDEALTGLARGFAFQMAEAHGILTRDKVANDVKALDQEARGLLRKHGVRFGQFTIFMPLLLKPAPTRLRLVLWSLQKDLAEFPAAPPPGLVTIPTDQQADADYHTMSGYRAAGERAIRIDMLERLADLLRPMDSRGGFEATPDMLSITGMTLEQFANLMEGLGYKAERGEREKQKPEPKTAEATSEAEAPATEENAEAAVEAAAEPVAEDAAQTPDAEAPAEAEAPVEAAAEPVSEQETATAEPAEAEAEAETEAAPADETAGEMVQEVFFTFTWAPRRRNHGDRGQGRGRNRQDGGGQRSRGDDSGKPGNRRGGQNQGKSQGDGPGGKSKFKGKGGKRPPREDKKGGPKVYAAKPPRKEKPIDPDNPFAALAALKDKS
ncbi:MAG: disulfide oxidoreductase, partial [Mangrovicoccus sp.]